ncbi:hypothetical protein BGZ49_003650 [Haplosporangium sp. Z 27]|nr:hypothetical protein BGZ49_003650 [Haplosporangium sp. Z 27]
MILLKNTQSILKLPSQKVKSQIQMLITAAGYSGWDIGVRLTGDKTIRNLNSQYRGKDKPTDILSFPFTEAVKPGVLPKPISEDDKNLGDIFISVRYVQKWCKEHNVDIEDRLPVLYAHGICHLIGYDHQDDKDYITMKRKEAQILKKMKAWQSMIAE